MLVAATATMPLLALGLGAGPPRRPGALCFPTYRRSPPRPTIVTARRIGKLPMRKRYIVDIVSSRLTRTIHTLEDVLISWGTPARGAAAAAQTRALIEPLMTLVTDQGATIRDQAETIGHLRAQLEAASAEVARAQVRETQLFSELERLSELERRRTEHRLELPEKADGHTPTSWRVRVRQGALVTAVLAALALLIIVLLFVLPPLDANL